MTIEIEKFWLFYTKNCKEGCMNQHEFYTFFPQFLNFVQAGHQQGIQDIPFLGKNGKSYILNIHEIIKKVNE